MAEDVEKSRSGPGALQVPAPGRGTLIAVIMALAILLSACLQGEAPDDEGPTDDLPVNEEQPREAGEMAITLEGCRIIEAFAARPADEVRAHVPDDFALALDPSGTAVVVLGGLICGPDGTASQRGLLAVLVEPLDAALSAGDEVNHFWEPEHVLVPGTAIAEAFAGFGANATVGERVRHSESPLAAELHIETAHWTHSITTQPGAGPGGEVASAFGHFREYSAADGGYVYLEARFEGNPGDTFATGLAEVRTGAGTVSRAILGAESTHPYLGGTGAAYADAKVGFIARP